MISLQEAIKERILILDGGMGTMIQGYGLKDIGLGDSLNLTHPEIVEDIHKRYLQAGADIIETNTFSSQRISLKDYGLEKDVVKLNSEACRIARNVADEFSSEEKPRYVVGSIGPTNRSCSMSPDVDNPSYRNITFDEMADAYAEQIGALIDGDVDALLIETAFDTLNVKAALYAAGEEKRKRGSDIPVMLSVTISDKAGRMLSGQTLDAMLASVEGFGLFSVGLNCSFGPKEIRPFLKQLSQKAGCYISVYPNAGMPDEMGRYLITPEDMAGEMKVMIDEGLVNIIGGCCGTTDKHIAAYKSLIKNEDDILKTPHKLAIQEKKFRVSGLELLEKNENEFLCIGERCNVAGSKKFLRLIKEHNYQEALSICMKQIDNGAKILDINMDDGMLDSKNEMIEFINLMASEPEIARWPFMIDSSDWDVILEALKRVQGKCIVNSISLKEGEEVFLSHAQDLKKMGAAVVVMAFDENGQACDFRRKTEVCKRAYHLLVDKVGFSPEDIIFDPNILTIGTGMAEHGNYAKDFIEASAWIRRELKGSHVSGGLSNLSFAFRGNNSLRQAIHTVFLYHAIRNGMDMAILNPGEKMAYEDVPAKLRDAIEDLIFNRRDDASDRLVQIASETLAVNPLASGNIESTKDDMAITIEERLKNALAKGREEGLETLLAEALTKYENNPIKVIEGPLMAGMEYVGEEFGQGRMYLPQVVKTARTMKKAVTILSPYIINDNDEAEKRPTVLLATVKGDVHDIGKNIVSVVMACGGYRVVDLGVMVPAEKIVEAVIKEKPSIIGLSALITPSLAEMVNVAKSLKDAGIDVPIMIGGATTSLQHTALKIAPVYDGSVIWVKDASQNNLVASKILSDDTKLSYTKELKDKYELIQREYVQKHTEQANLEEARKNKLNLFS